MVLYFYSVLPNKEAGNMGLLKIVLPHTLQAERLPGLPCWERVWRQEAAALPALELGIQESVFTLN